MKTSKRILATIVAVMLVVTSLSLPTFAAFTDMTEETSGANAANVLNMLGVINGYPDGSFGPEKNVTRAEFTAMLLRTRGMGSVGSTSLENPPFPDVTTPDVSWAIGNIRTAREMGIINGYDDGTFKPNNNVSYEEAVKMIVCALGYGEMGAEGAFWYSKYLMTATSLKFTEGAGGAISTPATRQVIANMLYNCLEVKLAENNEITNKTILENDLKLTKNTGYISSNPTISLTAPDSSLREDEIEVVLSSTGEKATYKVDDAAKYNDMLGAQITFYAANDRESGFKTIISATVDNTDVLEIEASNIKGSNASSIEYFKNADDDRAITANIASSSVVVYNGKLYDDGYGNSSFADYVEGMPSIGKVKLLDRNGDKNYDVVFIDSYTTWFVSVAAPTNETITDNLLRSTVTKQLTLKESNTTKIVDANGKDVSFSSIKKGNIISVKVDSYGGITAVVTNDSVTGKITATSSKKGVTINGKTYKYSKQAPWNAYAADNTALTEPQFGDSGKFYLDIDGNIVAYDKTEAVVAQYYGYIAQYAITGSAFDETLQANILTQSNPSGKVYTITTKTKINGTPKDTLKLAKDALDAAAAVGLGVKFTVGKNNELDELVLAASTTSGEDIKADAMYAYKIGGLGNTTPLKYVSTAKELEDKADPGTGAKIYIGSAQIISVEDGKYKKMSLSDFSNGGTYKIEAFDVDKTRSAKFVVVHDGAAAAGLVKPNSTVMVVTDWFRNSDNRVELTGYVGKDLKSNIILSDTDSKTNEYADDIKNGDIIRLGTDSEGYYTVNPDKHLIFRTEDGYRDTAKDLPKTNDDGTESATTGIYPKKEVNDSDSTRYQVIWGSAYQNGTDRIEVCNDVLTTDTTSSNITALDKSYFTNAKVFMFDETSTLNKIEEVNMDPVEALGTLVYTGTGSVPSEVFIHMTRSNVVSTLVIIKRANP